MADLYSVIAGIQPDQQDVIEAELLAKQILEAQFPDLDLREGTGVRDLVLRPAAFLLALCKKGVDFHFVQNTIAGITDESPTELVDGILGNLFLTRNTGTLAVINARLFFARQKAITLTTGTSFSPNNSELYFPAVSTTFPAAALQLDTFSDEWFIDVDLVAAEKGTQYNISSGSLLYFNSPDPFFLRGEINFLVQSSTDPETNSQFIGRAETSISTRNLINKPSISAKLLQDFNYLNRIKTVGAGDVEIFRDQVEAKGKLGNTVSGTSWFFSDSNTKLTVLLTNHNLHVGSLVNLVESGAGSGLLTILRQPVSDVVDPDVFKVLLPYSFTPRSLAFPFVTYTEEDVFVHQGGNVDVHLGEELTSSVVQFTLDVEGKVDVPGAIYSVARSFATGGSSPDTVPELAPFDITFAGHTARSGVALSQDITGIVTLNMTHHPLSIGRMVKVSGWPTLSSTLYLVVTDVPDQDSVVLGRNLPTFSVGSGLTPTVTYVYPGYDTGFSDRQVLTVDFGVGQANGLASFELGKFENLDSVQNYLELDTNRVICADYLARGFDIYVLDFDINVYDITAPSSGEMEAIIVKFLKALSVGQEFLLSDLVATITAAGVSKLKTPLGVTYSLYTKDLFPTQTGTVVDALHPINSTSVFILGSVVTGTEATP